MLRGEHLVLLHAKLVGHPPVWNASAPFGLRTSALRTTVSATGSVPDDLETRLWLRCAPG